MKLLYCQNCHDVFNLSLEVKTCQCGQSVGKYTDRINAIYQGNCVPIGFHNAFLTNAIKNQPKSGKGKDFTAFVIPKQCDTMKTVHFLISGNQ